MANTTNYNWETPDDTDLVKDGAAAIRTLGSSIDTTTKALNPSTTLGDIEYRSATANTNTRLGIGTTGQVLTVAGGVPTWATSDDANAIQNAIVDAKGDIVAASAADTPARLAVGTDNQRLVAASGEATGLKYVSDTQNTVVDAAGDLLYGTAADTLGRLGIGTAGQVLKVNSGATAPEWGAAGGSSGLSLIQRSTFSNVANTSTTFDGVFTSTYTNYLVRIEQLSSSTIADDLHFQFRYSGVTDTGYYAGLWQIEWNSTTIANTNPGAAGAVIPLATDSQTSPAFPFVGELNVGYIGTTQKAKIYGMGFESYGGQFCFIGGDMDVARTVTGFILKSASANISGTVAVYGLATA
jgi:hypothetical protein